MNVPLPTSALSLLPVIPMPLLRIQQTLLMPSLPTTRSPVMLVPTQKGGTELARSVSLVVAAEPRLVLARISAFVAPMAKSLSKEPLPSLVLLVLPKRCGVGQPRFQFTPVTSAQPKAKSTQQSPKASTSANATPTMGGTVPATLVSPMPSTASTPRWSTIDHVTPPSSSRTVLLSTSSASRRLPLATTRRIQLLVRAWPTFAF